MLLYFY